jgi:hypothetical protein
MATDFSQDPRFRLLPEHLQKDLENYEYTGEGPGNEEGEMIPYQEVQFQLDGIMVQCAVLQRKYVALPASDVERLGSIIKVWNKKELSR